MIETLTVESFKSIQSVTLELGQVNVFIGANGSGKSNLLEALAVLSAAASGKVNQSYLNERGCRSSRYYRPMFDGNDKVETHLKAIGNDVTYEVGLNAPPPNRLLPWKFTVERWKNAQYSLLNRPENDGQYADPETGLAALSHTKKPSEGLASDFLKVLAAYSIYSADTHILHGWAKDPQEREPVGLSGGRLAEALHEVWRTQAGYEALNQEFFSCVDWFEALLLSFDAEDDIGQQGALKISGPELTFVDRYFHKVEGRWDLLAAGDVNEGMLYAAFLGVLCLHPHAPRLLAIENVDQGLNPLLAKRLMSTLTERILSAEPKRQVFLTTHNPLVLDGLPLGDNRVRLFTVDRDNKGHTVVKRFVVTDKHREMAEKGWTLSRMWINKLIGGVPDV